MTDFRPTRARGERGMQTSPAVIGSGCLALGVDRTWNSNTSGVCASSGIVCPVCWDGYDSGVASQGVIDGGCDSK